MQVWSEQTYSSSAFVRVLWDFQQFRKSKKTLNWNWVLLHTLMQGYLTVASFSYQSHILTCVPACFMTSLQYRMEQVELRRFLRTMEYAQALSPPGSLWSGEEKSGIGKSHPPSLFTFSKEIETSSKVSRGISKGISSWKQTTHQGPRGCANSGTVDGSCVLALHPDFQNWLCNLIASRD